MKIILLVVLFLAVAGLSQTLTSDNVNVEIVDDGGRFAVAVEVHKATTADQAIVTYQFWEETAGYGKLLRTQTEVIAVVPNVFVMGNGILVERNKMRNVDIVLVKNLEKHHFDLEKK